MTLEALKEVARLNGYTVYDYSKSKTMLILLSLYNTAKSSSGISLVDNNGNKMIFIDDSLPINRQVFTLAHEIGHIVLKHNTVTSPEEKLQQEIEADQFATAVTGLKSFIKR